MPKVGSEIQSVFGDVRRGFGVTCVDPSARLSGARPPCGKCGRRLSVVLTLLSAHGNMFKKLSSAVSSFTGTPAPSLPASHRGPARAEAYADLAKELADAGVPVDISDCAACDHPCPVDQHDGSGDIVDGAVSAWDGKPYDEFVADKYGDLGELPSGFEQDWESDLFGSGGPPRGRIAVISTGKSDWERDHTVRLPSTSLIAVSTSLGSYQIRGFTYRVVIWTDPPGRKGRAGSQAEQVYLQVGSPQCRWQKTQWSTCSR